MFSGIIEGLGKIVEVTDKKHRKIKIKTPFVADNKIGDSISVNGVCLTITNMQNNCFCADIVPETLRCTNLGSLSINDEVNIERSLKLGDQLGGHFVQGHVDTKGKILTIKKEGDEALFIEMSITPDLSDYIVNKGFISIDGMSITIVKAYEDYFSVTLIPHTINATIAKNYQVGQLVNLEVDMLAKYTLKREAKKNEYAQ